MDSVGARAPKNDVPFSSEVWRAIIHRTWKKGLGAESRTYRKRWKVHRA